MKSIRTTLMTASLLMGLTGLSLAQTTAEPQAKGARTERTEKMHATKSERHERHLAKLKVKLKLEAGQESAWTAFEQSLLTPNQPMAHPDRAAMAKMTTPERIDQMQAHKAQRDAVMQKRADATKTFYAALNAGQKKVFDSETAHGMHSRGGGQQGGGHHGHH